MASARAWEIRGGSPVIGYRPDIEALRAISIAAVVLYHARIPGFSGGFVGVDIFFVISGFLITGMLLRELEHSGTIDLWSFWARRARRLLPNAYLAVAVTFIATLWLVPPHLHANILHDIIATLLYAANFRFADRAIDYFDTDTDASPLLHFWSLSVEEQFYIVWPLVLVGLAWRFRHRAGAWAVVALLVIAAVSFAMSIVLLKKNQPWAFFHTETRMWQLALGGLLAAIKEYWVRLGAGVRLAAVTIGMTGIAASIAWLNDAMPYPGWHALLPTLSAAIVIVGAGAHHPLLQPVFSLTPLQWIGARSYSLYLWHWPLLILAPHALPTGAPAAAIALIALGPIAAAAYRFVEDPIRRGTWLAATPHVSLAGAASAGSLIAAGCMCAALFPTYGWHQSEALARVRHAMTDFPSIGRDECFRTWQESEHTPCTFGAERGSRVAVLFGDSHAGHLFDGLNEAAQSAGWRLKSWTRARCPPADIPVWHEVTRAIDTDCARWREAIVQRILTEQPDIVFVSTFVGMARRVIDGQTGERLARSESLARWQHGFRSVLTRLSQAGIRVVLVRNTPRSKRDNVVTCLLGSGGRDCGTARAEAIDPEMPDVETARQVAGIEILDLADSICTANVCPALKGGVVVLRDNTHLTATFSKMLAPEFRRFLEPAPETAAIK